MRKEGLLGTGMGIRKQVLSIRAALVPGGRAGGPLEMRSFGGPMEDRTNQYRGTGPRRSKDPILRTAGLDCKSYFILHLLQCLAQLCNKLSTVVF